MRAEKGLSMDGFEVLTPLTDAFTPEHYERAEAGGITGIITMPWMFYTGPDARWPRRSTGCASSARISDSTAEAITQAGEPRRRGTAVVAVLGCTRRAGPV